MSNKYGYAHRELIKDANAGSVVTGTADAPTTDRGIGSIRRRQADVEIDRGDGKDMLLNALVKAGGDIGVAVAKDAERKRGAELDMLAMTPEGAQELEARAAASSTILFGDAQLDKARQQAALNQVNEIAANNLDFIETEAFRYSDEEWMDHTSKQLTDLLDTYEDQGMKDLIAAQYGKAHSEVNRKWEMAAHDNAQLQRRNVALDTMDGQAQTAFKLLDSADSPSTVAEAQKSLDGIFDMPEGADPHAWVTIKGDFILSTLAENRTEVYEYAKESGALDDITQEAVSNLRAKADVVEARNTAEALAASKVMREQANAYAELHDELAAAEEQAYLFQTDTGMATIQDIDQRIASGEDLQGTVAAIDSLFAKFGKGLEAAGRDQQKMVDEAMASHAKAQAEAQEAAEHVRAISYDNGINLTPAEGKTAMAGWEEQQLESELWRHVGPGQDLADVSPDTRKQVLWSLMPNTATKVRQTGIYPPAATSMARNLIQSIASTDFTQADLSELEKNWKVVDALADANRPEFAKAVGRENAEAFARVTAEVREGGDLHQTVKDERRRQEAKRSNTEVKLPNAEDMAFSVENMKKKFSDAGGGDMTQDIEADLLQEFNRLYPSSGGDLRGTEATAVHKVISRATLIDGRPVRDGQLLEKAVATAAGGEAPATFDRILQGYNDDPEFRKAMVSDIKKGTPGQGLPFDFDLRDKYNSYTPDGAGNMIVQTRRADGKSTWITLPLPQTSTEVLPTAWGQRLESIRSSLIAAGPLMQGVGTASTARQQTPEGAEESTSGFEKSVKAGLDGSVWAPHATVHGW